MTQSNTKVDSLILANRLRNFGYKIDIEMNDKKLKKSLEFADKEDIPYIIILGEDEIKNGSFILKDMFNGRKYNISLGNIKEINIFFFKGAIMVEGFLENHYDDLYIEKCLGIVDSKLKEYCLKEIIPIYELNDRGHSKHHIEYVLKRAFEISKNYDVDYNILYVSVIFHDIACHIDRETHEVLSAEYAYNDCYLKKFFSEEEMIVIRNAIEDHRASSKHIPRNIYGRILSSADRKVEIKEYLISSLGFNFNKMSKEELIEDSYKHAINKFGKEGYATDKFYVDDDKYAKFLKNIQYLIEHKEYFLMLAEMVYMELSNNSAIE